ncbi:MAG: ABC transporter ATP-binding protein [Sphingobacteriales bacterium]|nr:ABC transporter ATP-binding protein [Sphingobacteriales bacterium]
MGIAIKVENLSKAYQLGEIGTGTLSNDLKRWAYKIQGKEDPFLKIGETNDRTTKGESDIVWSLKDLNFEIEQGDAVGIIGRNGAGKSTLLKILSRVTTPTTGSVKIKGRVASLLEVGTGFHPELSGRDNIFLNGAILGMRKAEIKKHFDAIVDFAGVERYIDTPVKRYSSGMYVRLAFAVAAHLESEILVVDEVLAVGDAEFQKKCLGKMNEVSKGEGRTVLFVSHNMGMIKNLCDNAILLQNGEVRATGNTEFVINEYIDSSQRSETFYKTKTSSKDLNIHQVKTLNSLNKLTDVFDNSDVLYLEVILNTPYTPINTCISFTLQNNQGDYLSTFVERLSDFTKHDSISLKIKIPLNKISPNHYYFRVALFEINGKVYDIVEMICPIKILDTGGKMSGFEGLNYGFFKLDYVVEEI